MIYDINGYPIGSAYSETGTPLSSVYDISGNRIDINNDPYIPGRTLIFEDNFESLNSDNWGFELGRVRGNELQYYTNNGNNVTFTSDGLRITAKREQYVNADWTSASLTSYGKKSFKYGRIEVKAKFPKVAGAFPAFWTLGNSLVLHYYADGTWMTHDSGNWAYCGENDIVEHYAGNTDKVSCGAYYSLTDEQNVGTVSVGRTNTDVNMSEFHIYSAEWTETQMIYYLDGVQWSSFNITNSMAPAFRQPHYLLLNLAVGSAGGTPSSSTTQMLMDVKWVRVYEAVS